MGTRGGLDGLRGRGLPNRERIDACGIEGACSSGGRNVFLNLTEIDNLYSDVSLLKSDSRL